MRRAGQVWDQTTRMVGCQNRTEDKVHFHRKCNLGLLPASSLTHFTVISVRRRAVASRRDGLKGPPLHGRCNALELGPLHSLGNVLEPIGFLPFKRGFKLPLFLGPATFYKLPLFFKPTVLWLLQHWGNISLYKCLNILLRRSSRSWWVARGLLYYPQVLCIQGHWVASDITRTLSLSISS